MIVGDGNFSFSLAYLQKNPSTFLVTSSFESWAKLNGDQFTAENIKQLVDHSAIVLYRVDATCLHDVTELKNLKFDNIIFNFPHYGGKSNLKLNRQLIKDFFASAVNFITPKGRLSVSLCRGQGGTLADIPKRYDDTWKIVEMASFSGLILTSVSPFCVSDYPGYVSTGLRSQLKSFMTAGGLTHEFTLFQEADAKHWSCSRLSTAGEQIFFDSKRPLLHLIPWHPIFLIRQCLTTDCFMLIDNAVDLEDLTEKNINAFELKNHNFVQHLTVLYPCYAKYSDGVIEAFPLQHLVHFNDISSMNKDDILHVLTPSLELHLPEVVTKDSTAQSNKMKDIHLYVGQVYRNCTISLDTCHQPICHELMGVCNVSHPMTSHVGSLVVDWVSRKLEGMAADRGALSWNKCGELVNLKSVSQYCINKDDKHIPLVTTGLYFPDDRHSQRWEVFIVHLDSLACALFNIEDPRMLWSRDERFVSQFLYRKSLEQVTFHNFSLYAPTYSHDICFWVSYTAQGIDEHIEHRLTALVRRKCGEIVVSLTCINVWKPPTMPSGVCQELECDEVVSLCYRLIYSGITRGLSKPEAASIQSQLRLALMASDVKCKLR